jgi:glycerol kinase
MISPRSTALGSAILAACAIGLYGWNLNHPETLQNVNTKGSREFSPMIDTSLREKKWKGWQKAIEKSKGWDVEDI